MSKPRPDSPTRQEPVRSARLVVELGNNGNGASSPISHAVTVDLTPYFSGQNLEQLIRTVQGLRPKTPEPKAIEKPKKSLSAELVSIDSATAPSYRLKQENVVGRSKKCDLSISSAKVSRQHFRVSSAGMGFMIEDLGSANHTWVNDALIERPTPLTDGDVIAAGDVRFEYRVKI